MKLSSKFSNSEPDLPKFNTGIYRDTVGTIFATDLCESIRVSENNFSTLHNSKLAHIMISNKEVREKSKSAPCLKPKKPDEVELLSQALNELEVAVKYGRSLISRFVEVICAGTSRGCEHLF